MKQKGSDQVRYKGYLSEEVIAGSAVREGGGGAKMEAHALVGKTETGTPLMVAFVLPLLPMACCTTA